MKQHFLNFHTNTWSSGDLATYRQSIASAHLTQQRQLSGHFVHIRTQLNYGRVAPVLPRFGPKCHCQRIIRATRLRKSPNPFFTNCPKPLPGSLKIKKRQNRLLGRRGRSKKKMRQKRRKQGGQGLFSVPASLQLDIISINLMRCLRTKAGSWCVITTH